MGLPGLARGALPDCVGLLERTAPRDGVARGTARVCGTGLLTRGMTRPCGIWLPIRGCGIRTASPASGAKRGLTGT